jgi:hypothetical protein
MISGYSEIYNIGHRALDGFFAGPVNVEEKIDGSQISFGIIDGELLIRSKRCPINPVDPDNLFKPAVDAIVERGHLLKPGLIYRGEAVCRHRHNTLQYARTPVGFIVIYDICGFGEHYLNEFDRADETARVCFEPITVFGSGIKIDSAEQLRGLLENESQLGGAKIEGVVCKPVGYDLFDRNKKVLMAKYVSEAFKEKHTKAGNVNGRSGQVEVVQLLGEKYRIEARWRKAVQHLRESGKLESDPTDIPHLMKEVVTDIEKEESEAIKQELFNWAWPQLKKLVNRGLPEWYKGTLVESQFAKEVNETQ